MLDHCIIAFYVMALLIIYLIEIEQLLIADPANFQYPFWPPRKLIDLTHWWGSAYHGTLYYRPAWYKATIWFDVLLSGPVYVAGIYAFWKKKSWIKFPALIQATFLLAIVLFSMWQEIFGVYAGEQKLVVLASMILWIVVPCIIVWRCMQINPRALRGKRN
jgi:hypothetical protein